MITLTGGNVQTLAGLAVPNGSITLTLNGDAAVIASPGFVAGGVPVRFKFDSTGNLSGSCKVWSNAELTPQTQYLVTFYDQNGDRLNQQPIYWQFTQASGASVDIGTIIPSPVSSTAVLVLTAQLANTFFAGPTSGPAAAPTFRALITADLPTLPFPGASTLGGVQSFTAAAHQFLTGISTLGVPTAAQPAAADLSDGTDGTGKVIMAAASTGTGNAVRASAPTITSPTVSNVAGLTPSKQIFTGNGTFTIPAGVTAVKVTVVGAGGAGGGATTTASASGTGGGGGGCAIKWLTGLTPGNTLAVTIGTGGTGVANAAGNGGGNSTVASGTQTISTITGGGGAGGAATGNVTGDIRGTASGGDLNYKGGQPSPSLVLTNNGSCGGRSIFGGEGVGGFQGAGGTADTNSGSGGGGAGGAAGGTVAGGSGANGVVIFEWMV